MERPTITRYTDEPHPDNEHEWKCWWVKKCFHPDTILTVDAIVWIHQCWATTMAGWTLSKNRITK